MCYGRDASGKRYQRIALVVPVLSINTSRRGNAKVYSSDCGEKGWPNTTTWRELPGLGKASTAQWSKPLWRKKLSAPTQRIGEMDAAIGTLLAAKPDVLLITGDHSTPPSLKAHSWHPVPVLMHAPHLRGGGPAKFDEVACRSGEIGTIPSKELMALAMAHAGKLEKFGA